MHKNRDILYISYAHDILIKPEILQSIVPNIVENQFSYFLCHSQLLIDENSNPCCDAGRNIVGLSHFCTRPTQY